MTELRYHSRGNNVLLLAELLVHRGYPVVVSLFFGHDVDQAVRRFQEDNGLVVDGRVGPKTWACLSNGVDFEAIYKRSINDEHLAAWAKRYEVEPMVARSLNEVFSLGRGFLLSGRPIIHFHGEVFWKELELRGLNPNLLVSEDSASVIHRRKSRKFQLGGEAEYDRLQKAIGLSESRIVKTAANCATSWGAYQVMGKYFSQLGYDSIHGFIEAMRTDEKKQWEIFGQYLEVREFRGKPLIDWLRENHWRRFAIGYAGDLKSARAIYRQLKRTYKHYQREQKASSR